MSKANSYISEELRQKVAIRANRTCEYCLLQEEDAYFGCEIDHIISVKHNGLTNLDNLAFACLACNRYKGSDIASYTSSQILTRFFNPRIDVWNEHFTIKETEIIAKTPIGEVTGNIFRFNDDTRKLERLELQAIGRYPIK